MRSKLIHLKKALQQEGEQSLDMFETYIKFTQGKASEEEMNQANEQFKDLLKTLGLGVFAILPGAPITLPLVIKWGHKFGIDIVPDSFRQDLNTKDKK